jgi:hypothetical protein
MFTTVVTLTAITSTAVTLKQYTFSPFQRFGGHAFHLNAVDYEEYHHHHHHVALQSL